jgi:acyl carrier protein
MSDTMAAISDALTAHTGCADEAVRPDLRFDSIEEWSSLRALRVLTHIESRLRIECDLQRFLACETVGALAEALETTRGSLRGDGTVRE